MKKTHSKRIKNFMKDRQADSDNGHAMEISEEDLVSVSDEEVPIDQTRIEHDKT